MSADCYGCKECTLCYVGDEITKTNRAMHALCEWAEKIAKGLNALQDRVERLEDEQCYGCRCKCISKSKSPGGAVK